MGETTTTKPEIFVERVLDFADGDTVCPVPVRIYKPIEQGELEWGCILEMDGLGDPEEKFRREYKGADGVSALFSALHYAGIEIDRYKGRVSWNDLKPWQPAGFGRAEELLLGSV